MTIKIDETIEEEIGVKTGVGSIEESTPCKESNEGEKHDLNEWAKNYNLSNVTVSGVPEVIHTHQTFVLSHDIERIADALERIARTMEH